MDLKKHKTPEFQVIKQNEANARFFVASSLSGDVPAATASVVPTSGWF